MSRSKDSSLGKASQQFGGPSRISNFSPFRRGASSGQSSESNSAESMTSRQGRGLGDVSEVPSVGGKAAPPIKPPKPVGLRVKKAKALSISLLTGSSGNLNTDISMSRDDWEGSTSVKEKRQSRILLPRNTQSQYDEDPGRDIPARSKSALDHYKEHGPTKGLASPQWHDLEARDGLYSKKKKLSDWDKGRHEDKLHSDELFIISRRPSAAETISLNDSDGPAPPTKDSDRAGNSFGEIRAENDQRIKPATFDSPSFSDPQSPLSSNDYDYTNWEKTSTAKARSQSSLGMYSDKTAKSHSGSSATPFLNLYTARGQCSSAEAPTRSKKKSISSPLASLTRRNSFFSNLDRGPNSAPMSSSTDTDASQQSPKTHARTSSTMSNNKLVSHIPLAKPQLRSRTQSYAGFFAPQKSGSSSTKSQDFTLDRASSPLPPPPRYKQSRMTPHDGLLRVPIGRLEDDHLHPRSSSPFDRGALQAIGQQLGGIGAAVGKRGWDMMKSWNNANSGPSSPLTPLSARGPVSPSSGRLLEVNEATRKWNESVEPLASFVPTKGGAVLATGQVRGVAAHTGQEGGVFGKPLREAVLISRLAGRGSKTSNARVQLSALDLGNKFSIDLPDLSVEDEILQHKRVIADRFEARRQYLPAVVARCVEAIEKRGVDEEGIYRLSGRSSHTSKLKTIFDTVRQGADLQLVDIGPAELDLNSVCSILKAYLRALPDLLLTSTLSSDFSEAVRSACGMAALSEMTTISRSPQEPVHLLNQSTREKTDPYTQTDQENHTQRIATAIHPLMNRLPAVNWYLLREIAYHLGDLTREEIVEKTKMPLSNLCLVLAPTLSLSVVMVRVLVQAREQLFGDTYPLPDLDLDQGASHGASPMIPLRPSKGSYNASPLVTARESSRQSARLGQSDNDRDSRRTSVATVMQPSDVEKRTSSSSMATLQDRSTRATNDGNGRLISSSVRPTSSFFTLNGFTPSRQASPTHTFDQEIVTKYNEEQEEEKGEAAPPIAAHYLRNRSSSIANSIGSTHSSNFSSSRSLQIPKATSSTSLSSNAVNSSTMDSSVPSLPDRDSPKTADDHWPSSISHASKLECGSSSSNGSLTSVYKASIDRPRPTNPNPTRFFSR